MCYEVQQCMNYNTAHTHTVVIGMRTTECAKGKISTYIYGEVNDIKRFQCT